MSFCGSPDELVSWSFGRGKRRASQTSGSRGELPAQFLAMDLFCGCGGLEPYPLLLAARSPASLSTAARNARIDLGAPRFRIILWMAMPRSCCVTSAANRPGLGYACPRAGSARSRAMQSPRATPRTRLAFDSQPRAASSLARERRAGPLRQNIRQPIGTRRECCITRRHLSLEDVREVSSAENLAAAKRHFQNNLDSN